MTTITGGEEKRTTTTVIGGAHRPGGAAIHGLLGRNHQRRQFFGRSACWDSGRLQTLQATGSPCLFVRLTVKLV